MLPVANIINNVLSIVVWPVFGGAIVIMFIWAGFMFLTAAGDASKLASAKRAVIWGIVGIMVGVAGFSAYRIVSTILGV